MLPHFSRAFPPHVSSHCLFPCFPLLMTSPRWIAASLVLALALVGCSSDDPTAPPAGWETSDSRWWKSGVDTSSVFRNLEDLQTMGVAETRALALTQGRVSADQVNGAVKRTLLTLYRHDPETIDSLFTAEAAPALADQDRSGNIREKVRNEYKSAAYDAINDHYREPRRTNAGKGIVFPDSLRTEENIGTVELQVYVNAQGQPEGIELLEGVHPTLDAIALRATTQMEWQPAFLMVDRDWVEQPSFVRFGVDFGN